MHKLAHILRLGIKELTSLRHDSVLLVFLFYAFTVAIYMPAAGSVIGVHNACRTPWGYAKGIDSEYEKCMPAWTFNRELLAEISDLGATTLYFDAALFYNLISSKPKNYPVDNVTEAVCTTPDASTCTTSTVKVTSYNRYLFADDRHFTPLMQRVFVDDGYPENAYTRFKNRW